MLSDYHGVTQSGWLILPVKTIALDQHGYSSLGGIGRHERRVE